MKKTIKVQSIIVLVVLILNLLFPSIINAVDNTITITFVDKNLYNAIVEKLSDKIESQDAEKLTIQMSQENIDSITSLSLRDNISNIDGIEIFTNLKSVSVWGNQNNIIDLTPLSNLIKLETLSISYVTIRDVSVLKNLSNLTKLTLCRTATNDAPISENGFKDITVLKNMPNLSSLYINGYDIGNNSENAEILSELQNLATLSLVGCNISDSDLPYISQLKNLQELELGYVNYEGNNVTDITPLSSLTNLKTLYLCNNDISDLKPLENLANLTTLYLDQNNISNVSSLANLTNLRFLSFGRELYGKGNPLKDITPLSNLKNLTTLKLSNCDVDDITCLKSLTNLESLDISGNNISTINVLKDLSLTKLYLSKNDIGDATILDNELSEVKSLWNQIIDNQKITLEMDIGETNENLVELPTIFLQAKDQNSRLYTEEDYELVNCNLSSDGKSVIIDDGAAKASVKILGGEATGTILNISTIDKIPPILNVSYSTKELTNGTVEVTIESNEKVQPVEGWHQLEDKLKLTKTYAKNTQEEVKVFDLLGNETKVQISISNIDTDAPQADINYSTTQPTNDNVAVQIIADEKIQSVEGWTLSADQTTLEKVFNDNDTEEVTIYDLAGNKRTIPIKVKNIDKISPVVQVQYSTRELTNGNVEVQIKVDEEIQEVEGWTLTSDKTTLLKEFEENSTEEVTVIDLAGNTTTQKVSISNIDKIPPELSISYSEIGKTEGKVTVTIIANEKIQTIEGWNLSEDKLTLTKTYDKNTEEKVLVSDLAGNGTYQEIEISNIKDTTTAKKILPNTGKISIIIITIIFTIGIVTVLYIKLRNLKDVK